MSNQPYTNNCDLYFAIHENGINDLISRAMRYLPSFFNFTDGLNPNIACVKITPDPSVTARGDPLVSQIYPPASLNQPLSINFPQTSFPLTPLNIQLPKLNYFFQLTTLQVDFYPGNVITLPSTVPRPLPAQNLAMQANVSFGLCCPGTEVPDCFSLDLFAEMALKSASSTQFVNMSMNALDVVGLEPDGLREILDCYVKYFVNQILSWSSLQIDNLVSKPLPISMPGGVIQNLQVSPAVISGENNPAVEDDQLKFFMNLDALTLNTVLWMPGSSQSGSSQPGSTLAPPVSKAPRTRPGTGPSDLTIAISNGAFGKILGDVITSGTIFEFPIPQSQPLSSNPYSTQPWGQYGTSPIYILYKVGVSLAGGTINLQNPTGTQPNGSIQINNLQMLWHELKFQINIDLPQITVGAINTPAVKVAGITIIPAINFPGITLFGGSDIQIPIDLSWMNLVSEASISMEPSILYGTGNPNIQNCPNRWQLYLVPQLPVFVWPVFSFNLTNAITNGINNFFNNLFGQYPGPVVDAIKTALTAALTGVFSALSGILTDLGTVVQSIVDMIVNDNPGIKNALDQAIYTFFTSQAPIFEVPDPLVGPTPTSQNWGTNPLANVNILGGSSIGPKNIILPIPIPYLGVTVDSKEMVLEGDIGP